MGRFSFGQITYKLLFDQTREWISEVNEKDDDKRLNIESFKHENVQLNKDRKNISIDYSKSMNGLKRIY